MINPSRRTQRWWDVHVFAATLFAGYYAGVRLGLEGWPVVIVQIVALMGSVVSLWDDWRSQRPR